MTSKLLLWITVSIVVASGFSEGRDRRQCQKTAWQSIEALPTTAAIVKVHDLKTTCIDERPLGIFILASKARSQLTYVNGKRFDHQKHIDSGGINELYWNFSRATESEIVLLVYKNDPQ